MQYAITNPKNFTSIIQLLPSMKLKVYIPNALALEWNSVHGLMTLKPSQGLILSIYHDASFPAPLPSYVVLDFSSYILKRFLFSFFGPGPFSSTKKEI